MKKVIHIISSLQLGGAEEIATTLAIAQAEAGIQTCLVTVKRENPNDQFAQDYRKRLSKSGVQILELGCPSMKLSIPLAIARLTLLIGKWKPDLVHSHTDIPDLIVAFARRLRPFKIARTIHNVKIWNTHFLIGYLVESAFKDDLVIAISADTLAAYSKLRRRYNLSSSKFQRLIPNGITRQVSAASADRSLLETEFDASKEKTLLCFAGRFEDQKGLDLVLDALNHLPDTYRQKLEVHAFGSGTRLDEYKSSATIHSLPVSFHKPQPGISRFFRLFDAVLMPSRFEGLPLVAIETMITGGLLIAATAEGLRDTLPPDWPLTFPVEDSASLAILLKNYIDGQFDRANLCAVSHDWARSNFSADRMYRDYEQACQDYLK